MLKLLRFLITGSWHEHTFEVIDEYTTTAFGVPCGQLYVLQCRECGAIKRAEV
jgi:hypothetical protein